MDYKKAVATIRDRRKIELYEASALFDSALIADGELYETEKACRALTLEIAAGNKDAEKKLFALEKKKTEILKSMGITTDMLNPPPHCSLCEDTGFSGGGYCQCVKKLAIGGGEDIRIPLHDFSENKLELYEPEARVAATRIFAAIKTISGAFPNNKKRNVLINGPTGTGKTFLAGCMAKTLLERGMSVLTMTAFDFVNRMLSYHTTFNENKLSFIRPVLDCEVLIIDDLGTESILKNITLEYLYMVVNERMHSNKLTVLTSNLNADAILSRYGERLYSRLYDKTLGAVFSLQGNDIRLKP